MGDFNSFVINDLKACCVLKGEFTLRSGRKSTWYFDKYRLPSYPTLFGHVVRMLRQKIHVAQATRPYFYDAVAVPELGAIAFGGALAAEGAYPLIQVRKKAKEYGNLTKCPLEGAYEPAWKVIVVEDVITTGGAVLEAVEALNKQALIVEDVVCVLDRQEGGEENLAHHGLKLWPLFTAEDLGLNVEVSPLPSL